METYKDFILRKTIIISWTEIVSEYIETLQNTQFFKTLKENKYLELQYLKKICKNNKVQFRKQWP